MISTLVVTGEKEEEKEVEDEQKGGGGGGEGGGVSLTPRGPSLPLTCATSDQPLQLAWDQGGSQEVGL